ncbi:hypothetical protein [Janthinobacterium sp. OK676]|jgi:hypothetical protein|uniref:hypothetical protein n=1 Tax=Janthinobacterium sp. OK676 TaxID=1855295 RepID=UPI0011132FFA|nr:hypothetical protein [Janthinobacterium sp. OK676]
MKARIYLADGMICADLENGSQLVHTDAVELADQLWALNVAHDEVRLVDWHEDPDRAPLAGQKIAIHARLRLHENGYPD